MNSLLSHAAWHSDAHPRVDDIIAEIIEIRVRSVETMSPNKSMNIMKKEGFLVGKKCDVNRSIGSHDTGIRVNVGDFSLSTFYLEEFFSFSYRQKYSHFCTTINIVIFLLADSYNCRMHFEATAVWLNTIKVKQRIVAVGILSESRVLDFFLFLFFHSSLLF